MDIRTVTATRYVTPLREGGSLPAIIEADDDGLYVLKFRGAGQGPKALIAELLSGELARSAGLPVPEIVFVKLDAELARTEADPEIRELIIASEGLNLALDYLPGSIAFDPVVEKPDYQLASDIVWFDSFVTNIDRTPRNTNLLLWYKRLWMIDHGASLYFHHKWDNYMERSKDPFPMIRDHVLLPYAKTLQEADLKLTAAFSGDVIKNIVNLVPDTWLVDGVFPGRTEYREAYINYLHKRLEEPHEFLKEAIRARSKYV